MKPWIQNVSLADIKKGHHIDAGFNSMLIQIVDPDIEFPTPMYDFREVYQFKFLDIEDDGMSNDGNGTPIDMSWGMITDDQAAELVSLLKQAEDKHMNVVVHCVAGVCRSGAVCEVGVMMGFRDAESFRSPNLLVKHKMMRVLGWTYDEQEPHTINGVALEEDWTNDNEKVFTLAYERRKKRKHEGDI
jgi:predicted protein tyrosine phosphatase